MIKWYKNNIVYKGSDEYEKMIIRLIFVKMRMIAGKITDAENKGEWEKIDNQIRIKLMILIIIKMIIAVTKMRDNSNHNNDDNDVIIVLIITIIIIILK